MKHENGKLSCIFSILAFLLINLANYAKEHSVADLANPLIAPVINALISPLNKIEALINNRKIIETSITQWPRFYIFEHDAILFLDILSLQLTIAALYLCYRSIVESEENLWYANGINLIFLTVLSFNIYMGFTSAAILMYVSVYLRKVSQLSI